MCAGALLAAGTAHAQETTTYTYDPLGRLVASSTSGGSNAGVNVQSTYDPAGNRTHYQVTGAQTSAPVRFIVVPLNGLQLIPIPN